MLFPWRLLAKGMRGLWRFTFQRWWNFIISVPAFAGLIAGVGALTVADIGMVIGVTVLVGIRAGIVELMQILRRPAAKPASKRR